MGASAVKYKLGARAGKYKLGAKAGKYKLWARAGDKQRAGGREIQILFQLQYNIYAYFRSSLPEVFLVKRVLKNKQTIYKRTPMPKCDFNKVAKQL